MPNSTFDPLISCAGPATFAALDAGPIVPSVLGVSYCLVQSEPRLSASWRSALEGAGATILEVHPEDALLVSLASEAQCSTLSGVPDTRAVCSARPSHAPFGQLSSVFDPLAPVVPADLLDLDGSLNLVAGMNVGEDPHVYDAMVDAAISCPVTSLALVSALPAEAAAPGQLHVRVTDGDDVACVRQVVEWLSRLEATAVVLAEPTGPDAMDGANWFVQSGVKPSTSDPAPYWALTTPLFANGITGAGQVVALADHGIDNDGCAFTYGPYISDAVPGLIDAFSGRFLPPWAAVAAGSTNPADLVDDPATGWRPRGKVIANYVFDYLPQLGCPPGNYFDTDGHGTIIAGCAAGDDFRVSAARDGIATDDPFDNESAPDDYGTGIDHHQMADGSAPGAQIIVQKVQDTCQNRAFTVVDMLRQAYDTEPGARAHSNSTGRYLGTSVPNGHAANHYAPMAAEADGQLFRLRDLVMTLAAGNQNLGTVNADPEYALGMSACKNCISVAATKSAADVFATGNMMEQGVPPEFQFVSGHGPGFPFQIKPDLAVPSQELTVHTTSGQFEDGTGSGDGGCTYLVAGATSSAAPIVAGLALDVRQYFMDGYYGGGAPNLPSRFIPTNALVKAVLINSARNLGGRFTGDTGPDRGDRPSYGQGWGAVTLDDTLRFVGEGGTSKKKLFVLNDVPNGLPSTTVINDRRAEILDAFKAALWDGQIHEFEVWPGSQDEDLTVTLAWSDVEGNPGAGTPAAPCSGPYTGQPPLRNDLDLEIISPDGKVWRPGPGGFCSPSENRPRAGSDPARLWEFGVSRLGDAACPAGCPGACPDLAPPDEEYEQDHRQGGTTGASPFCDFAGRDRHSTVENIFIPAGLVVVNGSPYRIRVIGYDVQGNGRSAVQARPNFVDLDGSHDYDVISDRFQGYALIARGDITTEGGNMEFSDAEPLCAAANAKLFVTTHLVLDPHLPGQSAPGDPTVGRIIVTASSGDCDEFELVYWPDTVPPGSIERYAAFIATEPLPSFVDPEFFGCGASRSSPTGAVLQGNGIVQVADDGWITARLEFPGIIPPPMKVLTASTRTSCRGVALAVAAIDDGCDDMANAALNPGEIAWIDIGLLNDGLPAATVLSGELRSQSRFVTAVPSSLLFTGAFLEGRVLIRADAALGGIGCPATVGFELELRGEDGFRDRVFFLIPVDCTPDTTPPLVRPAEVVGDTLPPEDGLWVRKYGSTQADLAITWDPAPQPVPAPVPPYVYTYDIWEGDLRGLLRNGYSHVLPLPGSFGNDFCHVPQGTLADPAVLTDRAILDAAWRYYLVTAGIPCPSGVGSLDGPWGHPDRNADGLDDAEEIPAGRRLSCP